MSKHFNNYRTPSVMSSGFYDIKKEGQLLLGMQNSNICMFFLIKRVDFTYKLKVIILLIKIIFFSTFILDFRSTYQYIFLRIFLFHSMNVYILIYTIFFNIRVVIEVFFRYIVSLRYSTKQFFKKHKHHAL